jgi:hypothetical protein
MSALYRLCVSDRKPLPVITIKRQLENRDHCKGVVLSDLGVTLQIIPHLCVPKTHLAKLHSESILYCTSKCTYLNKIKRLTHEGHEHISPPAACLRQIFVKKSTSCFYYPAKIAKVDAAIQQSL